MDDNKHIFCFVPAAWLSRLPHYGKTLLLLLSCCALLAACLAPPLPKSPLHEAVKSNNLNLTTSLATGATEIDVLNEFSDTPLLVAAGQGNPAIVKVLLEKGADVNYRNPVTGETPLIRGSKYGNEQVARLLLAHGASSHDLDNEGCSAATWACRKGRLEVLKLLFDKGLNPNEEEKASFLLVASAFGQKEIVRFFLSRDADVNIENQDGKTPLILASNFGHTGVMDLLIENNARLDHRDNSGGTALYHAARMWQNKAAAKLIDHGARINRATLTNETPFYRCAFNETLANLLFAHGGKLLEVEAKKEQCSMAGHSFKWFARYFEKKLAERPQKRKELGQEIIFAYETAGKYYRKTGVYLDEIADQLQNKQIARIAGAAIANTLLAYGAQTQARIQAQQMAEINALQSSSGVGTGSGVAFYQTYSPHTEKLEAQETIYRRKAKEFRQKAAECDKAASRDPWT